jgi:hypothetical protein
LAGGSGPAVMERISRNVRRFEEVDEAWGRGESLAGTG